MNQDSMQHGIAWRGEDLTGWIASVKYDGCRGFWDGHTMWTRGGKAVANHWNLPEGMALDGELYAGIDGSRKVASAIRSGNFAGIRFVAFDAPSMPGDYLARHCAIGYQDKVRIVELSSSDHALELMRAIQSGGGEGLMARHPGLDYKPGRTSKLLKVKYEIS